MVRYEESMLSFVLPAGLRGCNGDAADVVPSVGSPEYGSLLRTLELVR
jgi:hypothetical protein